LLLENVLWMFTEKMVLAPNGLCSRGVVTVTGYYNESMILLPVLEV
jgi:hypothetical protein